AIMVKALADRLVEAFAEWLHYQVRHQYWGYAPGEEVEREAILREEYRGIRPAPGYPACPDHGGKEAIFSLLGVTDVTGMTLTDSWAMHPAASVCGYYFSHPEARYFRVGTVGEDQREDYARRQGIAVAELSRRLAGDLGDG
ncbi:MAG: methionine synthase, partial [Magnetococcales bacterium]|nr:methionine synthase [Magnetococcales bacterium]